MEYIIGFLLVITVIVFVHEYGHYLAARFCGVKVEVFSIGFGKELFGFYDKNKTRWKFAVIPAGGYVKMYGDANAASVEDKELLDSLSEKEKKLTFYFKPLWQKAIIVFAGPFANFLFSFLLLFVIFIFNGKNYVLPVIDHVLPGSIAYEAGIRAGDKVIEADGKKINDFSTLATYIASNPIGSAIDLTILRQEEIKRIKLVPKQVVTDDGFGGKVKTARIGIGVTQIFHKDLSIGEAVTESAYYVKEVIVASCKVLWQIISGNRNIEELSGPVKIAKISGDTFALGFGQFISFIILLSISLGFINLLPLPLLDGGHLFTYLIEFIAGRKFSERYAGLSWKVGAIFLIAVTIIIFINDIKSLTL